MVAVDVRGHALVDEQRACVVVSLHMGIQSVPIGDELQVMIL